MNRKLVTAGVLLGLFVSAIESTVVGTAMPTVIAHLGGIKLYSLVFAAYMLSSTVTLPLWGKLSDTFGRRGVYIAGAALFALGSVLSGLAHSMPELIAFRALQGLGAGAIMPLGFTIVGEIYSLEERARIQGLLASVWGIASIVGPLAGGFLTDRISWRAVFFLPVPIALVAAGIVGAAFRDRARPARRRLDLAGAALLTGAATALLTGASLAGRPGGFVAPSTIALAGAAVVLSLAFVAVERRALDPIVHLDLFRVRLFTATSLSGLFAGMAMFGIVSFTPLFVQAVIGTRATAAGASLTPFMLGWVAASTIGARLALRTGYRSMAVFGMVSLACGIGVLATAPEDVAFAHVAVAMGLCGVGMGASFSPLLIAVQSAVPRERLGVATSGVQFFRQIGGAVGTAILGAVLAARVAAGPLPPGVAPEDIVDPHARDALSPAALAALRHVLAAALHGVFRVEALLALAALALSTLVPGGAAREHAHDDDRARAAPAAG